MKIKILMAVLFIVSISACSTEDSNAVETAITMHNNSVATAWASEPYSEITFAGKVVNQTTDKWESNRLVLVFLNSKEIARTISSTMEYAGMSYDSTVPPEAKGLTPDEIASNCISGSYPPNFANLCGFYTIRLDKGLGIADGVFILRVPNTYQLNRGNLGIELSDSPFVEVKEDQGPTILGTWLDTFIEGDTREFSIPSKNLRYILKVLPSPISQLPAEIQQPGSIALLDGNRLVAVDPNAPEPTPQSAFSNSQAQFEQVTENVIEFPSAIFPLNNCGGGAEIKQEITQTYIHEIIDESKPKFGIELPLTDWLKIVFEIEKHYGVSDKQITAYSTTLAVPAGQNIEYTVVRKQTWESGIAVVNNGVDISAPYRILKSETFEVVHSQSKTCP